MAKSLENLERFSSKGSAGFEKDETIGKKLRYFLQKAPQVLQKMAVFYKLTIVVRIIYIIYIVRIIYIVCTDRAVLPVLSALSYEISGLF